MIVFLRHHRTAKPKWVNPCGINTYALRRLSGVFGGHGHYEVRPLSNAELLENVILAAKNALRHSKVFKEDYVSREPFFSRGWELGGKGTFHRPIHFSDFFF